MYPCQNSIEISGPDKDIQFLLSEWNDQLVSLIDPHGEEDLDDFLDIEVKEDVSILHLRNLDTNEPPIELIKALANSLYECKFSLEYLNADRWFAGILEIDQCTIKQEEKYHYKSAQDLQEFANRTGHLDADVMAFSMKDMPCYMENEELHKYQTRNESGELQYFESLKEAFKAADQDKTIWKISWDDGDHGRVRMVRKGEYWKHEPFEVSK